MVSCRIMRHSDCRGVGRGVSHQLSIASWVSCGTPTAAVSAAPNITNPDAAPRRAAGARALARAERKKERGRGGHWGVRTRRGVRTRGVRGRASRGRPLRRSRSPVPGRASASRVSAPAKTGPGVCRPSTARACAEAAPPPRRGRRRRRRRRRSRGS